MTQRREFNLDYIGKELDRLDSALTTSLNVYVAGGFVLADYDLKPGTKDIDVILEDQAKFRTLVKALLGLHYRELTVPSLPQVYANLSASAILENDDGFRWDIFERVVADKLSLTDTMKSRATPSYVKKKLTMFLLSKEDIFLMKAMTDRDRDLEDMFLISRSGIDYDAIFDECILQSEQTDNVCESGLYDKCMELNEHYGLKVPFMRKLRKVAEEKLMMRALSSQIKEGHDTEDSLTKVSKGKLRPSEIKFGLKLLSEKGKVRVMKNGRIVLQSRQGVKPKSGKARAR